MASVQVEGVEFELDDNGFLKEPDKWNPEVAKAIAQLQNLEQLTEAHWKVINYVRDYYLKFNVPPIVRKLCRGTGSSIEEIYELFPSGPVKGACRIAGLPLPSGCV